MTHADGHTILAAPDVSTTAVAESIGAEVVGTAAVHRRWFDTFDWSLWNAGLVLEADASGPGPQDVVLRDRHDHRSQFQQRVAEIPRTVADLPSGPWRRYLGRVLGIRALVPVAEGDVECARLRVTDDRGKTTVEVRIEVPSAEPGSASWIRVVPMRGYDREAEEVVARLACTAGLRRTADHPLRDAVVDGREPGTSSIAMESGFERDTPAAHAVASMLRDLSSAMALLEPWLSDPPDTEFLHDWRVALRRSRSVLKFAAGIVPAPQLDRWRPTLRALQIRSGEARDLDVFVLEFDSYLTLVPAEYAAADLEPLRALLRSRRDTVHQEFAAYLRSSDHERLRRDFATMVEELAHADPTDLSRAGATDAGRPIGEVGAERVRRAYERTVRRGRKITASSPAEDLHAVRKVAKELRYAIELHAPVLDPRATRTLVRSLKALQDILGDYQDAEVHAHSMALFADHLVASGDAPARSIMAIGLLAQAFTEQNAETRTRFDDAFAQFDDRATRRLLDRATGSTP